jgi:hypothetical protein
MTYITSLPFITCQTCVIDKHGWLLLDRNQHKKAIPDELSGEITHQQSLSINKASVAKPPVICQGGFFVGNFAYAYLSFS